MMIGAARRPLHANEKCGDAFAWWHCRSLWTLCLVDGLGHGTEAALAADVALAEAEAWKSLPPCELIDKVGKAIQRTRGAAMAVVQIDTNQRTLCHAGVGNVRAGLFGDTVVRFEGTPGVVGTHHRTAVIQTSSWNDNDILLLWTDGFSPYLSLDASCLRLRGEPQRLIDHLITEHSSTNDDAGIVCCLLEGSST